MDCSKLPSTSVTWHCSALDLESCVVLLVTLEARILCEKYIQLLRLTRLKDLIFVCVDLNF